MGQSTVVATAFTAIMFVAGVSILVMSTVSSFGTLYESLNGQAEIADAVLSERIEIDDWLLVDSSTIRVNVSNVGSTSIMMNEFRNIDVLIDFSDGSRDHTDWVSYDQSGSTGVYWRVFRVFFRNEQGDMINPLGLSGEVSGAWDPEETLEIEIKVDEASPEFTYLSLITPVGVQAHTSFSKEYDLGSAIVHGGTRVVVVSHLLDRVPENVQLTPGSQINTEFWVEWVDSDSFEIHLSNNPPSDVLFYWKVE